MRRDQEIERELKRLGWTVLRFWNSEIERSPVQVAKTVAAVVRNSA